MYGKNEKLEVQSKYEIQLTSRKLERFCFAIMMLMLSLFNRGENETLKLVTNASMILFIGVELVLSLKCLRFPAAFRALALFVLFCGLSTVYSTARDESMRKVVTLLVLLALCMAVIQYLRDQKEIEAAISIIAMCTLVTALYTILRSGEIPSSTRRVSKVTGDSNQASAFIAHGVVMYMYLWVRKKWPRILLLFGMVTAIVAIALLGSRSGIVVVCADILIAIFLTQIYNRTDLNKKVLIAFLALLTLVGVYLVIMSNDTLYMTLGRRLESFVELRTTGSSSIHETSYSKRRLAYSLAFKRFLENPLFGKGIASFAPFSVTSIMERNSFCPSNYLELLQGVGLIGTLLYYSVYFILFWNSWQDFRDRVSFLTVPAVGVLLSMLAMDMTVVFYYEKLEYVFFGLVMAICIHNSKRRP